MIGAIIRRYEKYDLYYHYGNKTLYIYKPILVKDLRNIQNIIRDCDVDIKNIIVGGR